MRRTKTKGLLAVVSLGLLACVGPRRLESAQPPSSAHPHVIVHLFEWRWNDIAEECERVLGPAGYSAVQISPPNEHVLLKGRPWYERYQPISYKLVSRSGTREELVRMVQRCAAVGVDIYADAVLNHMSGKPAGTGYGIGGSPYSYENYPGLWTPEDFHHCGRYGTGEIRNYQDRWEVQNCTVFTLSDLNTGSERVRARLATYLQSLLDIGIRGFRIDAAKHVAREDLASIFGRLNGSFFVFQEVIDPGTEPIKAQEYLATGAVTEFAYGHAVAKAFRARNLSSLRALGEGLLPSNQAVVFIDNHDNQRGHGGGGDVLTHREPEMYRLANVFMLAWPYGIPAVMSSYRFTEHAQPAPCSADGTTLPSRDSQGRCAEGWVCEHRWPEMASLVALRKVSTGAPVTRFAAQGLRLSFAREGKAFVALNGEDTVWELQTETGLPTGAYCNVTSTSSERCDVVSVGVNMPVRLRVPPKAAVALHVGSRKTSAAP